MVEEAEEEDAGEATWVVSWEGSVPWRATSAKEVELDGWEPERRGVCSVCGTAEPVSVRERAPDFMVRVGVGIKVA